MTGLGESLLRVEDADLLTGRARFLADIPRPEGCLDLRFVRSFEAHAVLVDVEVDAARSMPGVAAVLRAHDLPDLPDVPASPGIVVPPAMVRHALARDRVRFVGEAYAAVLAETMAQAEDAAEEVVPDLVPLPPVIGIADALAEGTERLFEAHSNLVEERVIGATDLPSLDSAPIRFQLEVRHGRVAPASIEPRGILVVPERGGRITIWCSHQAPHRLKQHLAEAFDIESDRIHVIVPAVGGAFGGKSATFPEYVVAVHAARSLGRPVRWVEDRTESLIAATHGRGQVHRLDVAADLGGRLLALGARVDLDVGAYPHIGMVIVAGTALMMSGPYRIRELSVVTRAVVTNATPIAPYRGAGRPEAALSLERAMDELARRAGLDPVEVRMRNFIEPDAFPYDTPTGARYDSGRYAEALERTVEVGGYRQVRAEQQDRRRSSERAPLLGVGLASYVERSGGSPGSTEHGTVEIGDDGSVIARSGSSAQGQGHATAFSQIVAAAFDVDPSRVVVVEGDTDEVPEGTGTFASRSIQIGGSALHLAAEQVVETARRAAANHLEVDPLDLVFASGGFEVVGAADRSVSLWQLAANGVQLSASVTFASPQAFPYGSHMAVVEIDPDTGVVSLRTVVAVDDCGRIVNPMLVEGQALGSMVQGIGQALFESVIYQEDGQPLSTSFLTYAVPSAADLPGLVTETMETSNPNVPLGAKGAGESGCIGTPAAIMNAVVDALEGYDTSAITMPFTSESILEVLAQGGDGPPS